MHWQRAISDSIHLTNVLTNAIGVDSKTRGDDLTTQIEDFHDIFEVAPFQAWFLSRFSSMYPQAVLISIFETMTDAIKTAAGNGFKTAAGNGFKI